MALTTCKECGKEISDQATSCPNCGHPIFTQQAKVTVTIDDSKTKFKGAKTTIGIISIILFVIISFQSCAAGVGNALSESGETSGSFGFFLALFMLIAGILTVVNRSKSSKSSFIIPACFYIIGGLFAKIEIGSFTDLGIWSNLSIFFGVLLIIFMIFANKKKES
ncbi:zinc ribbon protein [Lachnotalea glycerini]|uniref:Zinc ribbon protein n=1 Tax=Lachnotalea glycerini TaxID=1763509 RepID=A0A318EUB9_9FIRM|nr:zinc ribbon domain-containing protein [Lachnotalea glycerini]PXV88374.1 zinc ribbon protein [Lachnotalea glycerini]